MSTYGNVLTAVILLVLFVLVYCKVTKKTFGDLVKSIKDTFSGGVEEVEEVNPIK